MKNKGCKAWLCWHSWVW